MSLYQKNGWCDRCCRRGVRGGAVPEHALSPLAGGEGGGVSCLLRRHDGGVPSQAATSAASPVAARPESAPYPVGVLPTRRVWGPYTAKRMFSARYVTYVTYHVIIPWGVIVPHRNRTRVWVSGFYFRQILPFNNREI